MAIKNQRIVADFETTTTPEDVRVWAVCAVDIDTIETVHIGNNIEGFMQWLSTRNTVCYFHNLKFDGEFILHYLLTHGFKYGTERKPKTFETLITDDGIFYSITVIFEVMNKRLGMSRTVNVRCNGIYSYTISDPLLFYTRIAGNVSEIYTRDIIDAQHAGTRAILDFLTQDKIATLTAENQSLKFAASQASQNAFITANQEAQTAELIRRLGRDCPVPAYVVPNPNCCYGNPIGVSYGGNGNSGCGCGCGNGYTL